MYGFAPARPGSPIHGACAPWTGERDVAQWIQFMKDRGVVRVCSLLPPRELGEFAQGLVPIYEREFGRENVLSAHLDGSLDIGRELFGRVLPFLAASEARTVVHCRFGLVRTGVVLASWLAYEDGLAPDEAIAVAERGGRMPRDMAADDARSLARLRDLLRDARCLGEEARA